MRTPVKVIAAFIVAALFTGCHADYGYGGGYYSRGYYGGGPYYGGGYGGGYARRPSVYIAPPPVVVAPAPIYRPAPPAFVPAPMLPHAPAPHFIPRPYFR